MRPLMRSSSTSCAYCAASPWPRGRRTSVSHWPLSAPPPLVVGGHRSAIRLACGRPGATAWQAHRVEVQRDIARRDLAREEALRYELTRLFRKVLAENSDHQLGAKAMLDASAQHLLSAYRERPKLAGPLVITLADLYDALEDAQGGAALLQGYLAQPGVDADPASVADARQTLANLELLRGNVDRAGEPARRGTGVLGEDAQPL